MNPSEILRRLLDLVPEVVLLYDEEGRYLYANEAASEFLDLPQGEIVGRTDEELFPERSAETIQRLIRRALDADEPQRERYPLEMPSGETRHWESTWIPVSEADAGFRGVAGLVRDVTDRHRAERALARAKKQYAAVFDANPVALIVIDVSSGRVRGVNRTWEELYGYRSEEVEGEPVADYEDRIFVDPEYPERLRKKAVEEGEVRGELARVRRQDGRVRDVLISIVPLLVEDEVYLVGSAQDVSPMRETERDLRRRALHDALTGLPNRDLLRDRCEQAIRRSDRRGESFALLYLDLDGFKPVNDSLGHGAGDEVLVEVAERLQAEIRDEDTVARVGGDEFVLLLESVDGEAGTQITAERLLEAFEEPFRLSAGDVRVNVSIGGVVVPPDLTRQGAQQALDEVVTTLVTEADRVMYEVKKRGGGGARLHQLTGPLAASRAATA